MITNGNILTYILPEMRPLKYILFCLSFFISVLAFAQNDSVTSRQDAEFKWQIENKTIKEYQDLLNFISNNATGEGEIEKIIKNRVSDKSETQLFFNDKVRIDSDLKPGADTSILLRRDIQIDQYLRDFHTSYSKTEEPSITLTVKAVSNLKKNQYMFYNVVFECSFSGTNAKGEFFRPFERVAEVRLENNGKWRLYIQAVRFPLGNELDSLFDYMGIKQTNDNLEKIIEDLKNNNDRQREAEKRAIQNLIDEGDDAYDANEYESAIKKYREARLLSLVNKEIESKIAKAKEALEGQKRRAQLESDRQLRIQNITTKALSDFKNYNFYLSKVLCDSLMNDYGSKDPEIQDLNSKLTVLIASLEGIETAIARKDFKEAVKRSEAKIKQASDSLTRAEFNYRLANVYYLFDRSEVKKMIQYTTNAITLSGKRHQLALQLRSIVHDSIGRISDAIEDATLMINNDFKNQDLYEFRAKIYEKDGLFDKAIEDYGKSVSLDKSSPRAFIAKSRLENHQKKYNESIQTSTDGIYKHPNSALLYFYRCISKISVGDYTGAGADFIAAKKHGLAKDKMDSLIYISDGFLKSGDVKFSVGMWYAAAAEYCKAIDLDSNITALYNRGLCYINLNQDSQALTDFASVIRIKPSQKEANYHMALALYRLGRPKEGIEVANKELLLNKGDSKTMLLSGKCHFALKEFALAAKKLKLAAESDENDTTWYLCALSYFQDGKYTDAANASAKAISKKTSMYEVFAINARSLYLTNEYSKAVTSFERAVRLKSGDDSLNYYYGLALHKNREYQRASQIFETITKGNFRDSALLNAGFSMIMTRKQDQALRAVTKLNQFLINSSNTDGFRPEQPEWCELQAWLGYAYLIVQKTKEAQESIDKSQKCGTYSPMLNYVLACVASKTDAEKDALKYLSKAFPLPGFSKEDVLSDLMLKNIRKSAQFIEILDKAYPVN